MLQASRHELRGVTISPSENGVDYFEIGCGDSLCDAIPTRYDRDSLALIVHITSKQIASKQITSHDDGPRSESAASDRVRRGRVPSRRSNVKEDLKGTMMRNSMMQHQCISSSIDGQEHDGFARM